MVGLVQARSTKAFPGVAVAEVTSPGERLSTVIVAESVSVPAVVFVAVIAVTVAVVA